MRTTSRTATAAAAVAAFLALGGTAMAQSTAPQDVPRANDASGTTATPQQKRLTPPDKPATTTDRVQGTPAPTTQQQRTTPARDAGGASGDTSQPTTQQRRRDTPTAPRAGDAPASAPR